MKSLFIAITATFAALAWGQVDVRDYDFEVYENATPRFKPLEIPEGDTPSVEITLLDTVGGSASDLTGKTAQLSFIAPEGGRVIAGVIAAPATGVVTFPFSDEARNPGFYRWSASITGGTHTRTLAHGTLRILDMAGVAYSSTLDSSLYVLSTDPALASLTLTPGTLPASPVAGQFAVDADDDNTLKFWDGDEWREPTGIGSLLADPSPQLAADLDLNGNVITGMEIGADIQAYDAGLADVAGLAVTDGNVIVGDGANWVAESGATARASLGLTIGSDVQAYDATLISLAALGTAADRYAYTTGVDTWAEGTITSFGRSILDDANGPAVLTTIGAAAVNHNHDATYQPLDADLTAIAGLTELDGTFLVGSGSGWVLESGATARASLGVDAAGTDNSTPVTLTGSLDYLTLGGQQITLGYVDLTSDVTGDLPISEGGTNASDAATALSNLGGVAVSGTPVNNQVAVWTDAETIEGDAGLVWNGTNVLNLNTASGRLEINDEEMLHTYVDPDGDTATPAGENLWVGTKRPHSSAGVAATSSHHGSYNVGIGTFVLGSITTGYQNFGGGAYALRDLTTGGNNFGLGAYALEEATSASDNIGIGYFALSELLNDHNNIGIGRYAGSYIAGGGNNTSSGDSLYIGAATTASSSGAEREIVIGYATDGIGDYTVVLGNLDIVATHLRGDVTIDAGAASGDLTVTGDTTTAGITATGPVVINAITTQTAATYAVGADDYTILADTSSNTVEVDLPAAASNTGRILVVKKIHAGNTMTIDPNATEPLDGSSTSLDITTDQAGYVIQCDGSGWRIIGTF